MGSLLLVCGKTGALGMFAISKSGRDGRNKAADKCNRIICHLLPQGETTSSNNRTSPLLKLSIFGAKWAVESSLGFPCIHAFHVSNLFLRVVEFPVGFGIRAALALSWEYQSGCNLEMIDRSFCMGGVQDGYIQG